MQGELERIIETIKYKRYDWNQTEKLRYAYLELGKLVYKDAFFFYTIQNNLLNGKEELQYSGDTIEQLVNTSGNFVYKTICKNAAEMLQYIYKRCGIECEIRKTTKADIFETNGKKIVINHYFVVATGDEGKKYLMTLNPDLPNIKIGKQTSHFGNSVPYLQKEIVKDENGNDVVVEMPAYEGGEIDVSCLPPDILKEIDKRIGYKLTIYNGEEVYTDTLLDALEENYKYDNKTLTGGEYLDIVKGETEFYYDMCNLLNGDKTLDEILSSEEEPTQEQIENACIEYDRVTLTEDLLQDLKLFVILEVVTNLYNKFGVELNENELDKYKDLLENKDYNSIMKEFSTHFDGNEVTKLGPYNPMMQMKKTIRMINNTDEVIDKINNNASKEEIGDSSKKLFDSLSDVELVFVNDEYLPNAGFSLNSSYITHKLIKSFERVFDIGHHTDFNDLELAEQIAVVKEIINRVFTDSKLRYQDPSVIGFKKDEDNPVANRIYQTVLIDKKTSSPYYMMIAKNAANERERGDGLVPIIYDLKNNTLSTDKSLSEIYDSYFIIKDNDLKMMVEQIESEEKKK